MERNFLLTYLKDGKSNYEWFETLEEMEGFIEVTPMTEIFEAFEIKSVVDITDEIKGSMLTK